MATVETQQAGDRRYPSQRRKRSGFLRRRPTRSTGRDSNHRGGYGGGHGGGQDLGPDRAHIGDGRKAPLRWRRRAALALVLALVAGLVTARVWLREDAVAVTAFAARTGCVCRYVSGRVLDDCKGDLKAASLGTLASLVWMSSDDGAQRVSATVPLLASQSASYRADRGCQLEAWKD